MKTSTIKFVSLILVLNVTCVLAQKKVYSIAAAFERYTSDLVVTERARNLRARPIADLNLEERNELQEKVDKFTYNPKMMNMFIANNISNYLSSSKDISLQNYYAILESGDGSLFVGYNFMFRKRSIDRLIHIGNIGLKSNAENNFSKLAVDNQINPELGVNLKYTYLIPAKIKYVSDHRQIINNYRETYLKKKYKEDLKKYSMADSDDENTALEAKLKYATNLSQSEKQELIDNEYYTQYENIAKDEEKFINENKLYSSIVASWITIETYIPLRDKEYSISPAVANSTTSPERFYNFRSSFSATRMQKWSNKMMLYTTVAVGAFNTNNILTKELTAYKFETIQNQGSSNQTTTNTVDAYVGTYKETFAHSFKGEIVFFPFNDIIGASVSLENIGGELHGNNWKLGIPISLKDKDDKPSINFEIQYKEVNKQRFAGISVGYAFGKFFN